MTNPDDRPPRPDRPVGWGPGLGDNPFGLSWLTQSDGSRSSGRWILAGLVVAVAVLLVLLLVY
ncbi:hypothetical protein [Aeromicrobium sp. IC_218]|uniref:hypothetical protein n=1 Tax=Aeromicrobium sp. IC_218 TaxID=2545468 RepID=UPI00103FAE02|nr:hypothetical protein [Aeromicrobium sp. IC_218]TCI99834.1 hypothetical protein E0W78_05390 [Aeromicrobium sp. IC_218]